METSNIRPVYCTPGMSAGLLLIRLILAAVFIFHGCQILFGVFGGSGPTAFASHMHMPIVVGYLVGVAEFAGGLSMATGLLLPLGALAIVIVMIGAIFLVHWTNGFDIVHNGMEYALTQLIVAMGLTLTGPGAYTLGTLSLGGRPAAGSTVSR